jgi:hypothetical protein
VSGANRISGPRISAKQAALLREVRAKYRRSRPFDKNAATIADTRRVLIGRYGDCIPESEQAAADLTFVARVYDGARFGKFIRFRAPWFVPHIDTAIAEAATQPRATPVEISRHFDLGFKERAERGIRNLPPADVAGDDLKRRKAERKLEMARERNRRARAKAREMSGGQTRKQYLANSLTGAKPWEAMGISRASWYRMPKEQRVFGETGTDTPPLYRVASRNLSHGVADISNRLAA